MTDPSPFGILLRSLRIGQNLTLEALAHLSGVSVRTIGDLERGASASPQRRTVDALADGLGLDETARHSFLRAARARARESVPSDGAAAIAPRRALDFSGRSEEIRQAVDILFRAPVGAGERPALVISGAPGIGKTTAAVEIVARGQESSVRSLVFVGLDGLGSAPLSPLHVITSMLRQLPGAEQKPPADLAEARTRWRAAVDASPVAVVLDNVASEAQVRPLLSICAEDVVVVTSRRSLAGLEGVRRLRLGPLARTESIQLLRHLIPQSADDLDAVDEVAGLCDDIPLALRVVGNRLASRPEWTVGDLLSRMRRSEDRLRVLVAGDLAVEAAISVSYEELDPRTGALFRWLSVIDGSSFDAELAAAAARSTDRAEVQRRLDDLTDLGMLEAQGGDRYRLHDLMRLFASARLREAVAAREIERRRAHLRTWLLGSLERAGAWYEPGREPRTPAGAGRTFRDAEAAAAWIRTEAEHWWRAYIDAAELGEDALICDVADALHWYSDIWITWGNWHRFFSLASVAANRLGDARAEAAQLGYVAWAEIVEVGDREQAVLTARSALAVARTAEDTTQQGWAHYYVGWASWTLGRLAEAASAAASAIDAFTAAGEDVGLENAQVLASMVKSRRGAYLESIPEIEATLERVRSSASADTLTGRLTQYAAYLELVDAYTAVGRYRDAIRAGSTGIAIARSVDDDARAVLMMRRHIRALIQAGEQEAAAAEAEEALRLLGPGSSEAFIFARFRDEVARMGAHGNGRAPVTAAPWTPTGARA